MMNDEWKCKSRPGSRSSIQHSAFSIIFTLVCYVAAGPSLGLFIGGFFVAAFLAPAASLRGKQLLAVVAGIAGVWLIAIFQTSDTFWEWAQLVVVLASFSFGLAALAFYYEKFGVHPVFAGALATVLGLAWLTWPIWLSPEFAGIPEWVIDRMVSFHPPLVANGVLANEPPWTERFLAYRLTRLDQDTPITLPTNIWPCVGVNVGIGVVLMVLGRGIGGFLRWRRRRG
jgi:hypothetical protein